MTEAVLLQPPSGTPWDDPIELVPLAFVDVEATGLDPEQDRVVELCVERTEGRRVVDRIETLVEPDVRAGGACHVHGLTADLLAGAPRFGQLAQRVVELTDGAVLVAHSASWDVRYLEAEMARHGYQWRPEHYLDTLPLARRAFGLQCNRLGALAQSLGLQAGPAHRAGGDVKTLRELFGKLVDELRPSTARDLWHVRVGQRHARPEVLDACREALGSEPVTLTYRPSGQAAQRFAFVVTALLTELDPPRVIGYLLPGRGHRDLRMDRILAVEPAVGPSEHLAPGIP